MSLQTIADWTDMQPMPGEGYDWTVLSWDWELLMLNCHQQTCDRAVGLNNLLGKEVSMATQPQPTSRQHSTEKPVCGKNTLACSQEYLQFYVGGRGTKEHTEQCNAFSTSPPPPHTHTHTLPPNRLISLRKRMVIHVIKKSGRRTIGGKMWLFIKHFMTFLLFILLSTYCLLTRMATMA